VAPAQSTQNTVPGKNGGVLTPWRTGQSPNPGGRPKLARSPSAALAELNDMAGDDPDATVEAYKTARRKAGGLLGADHKAIAMFRAESDVDRRTHVSAFEASTDRLEGKVTQTHVIETDVRGAAQRYADELGVSVDEIMAIASKLAESDVRLALPAAVTIEREPDK
jgi:hypothetical protein